MSDELKENLGVPVDPGQGDPGLTTTEGGAQVEGSEGNEGGSVERPSRAKARIEQLAREKRVLREQVESYAERLERLEATVQGGFGRQPQSSQEVQVSEGASNPNFQRMFDQKWEEMRLKRESLDAEDYVKSQEGFDPNIDDDLIVQIAQENGWDETARRQPMKAAKLIVDAWKKEKGLSGRPAVPKSQVAGVQGSGPTSLRANTMDEANRVARDIMSSGLATRDPAKAKEELNRVMRNLKK